MPIIPVFLSVILVVRNQSETIEKTLSSIVTCVSGLVSEFEIVVIDNASDDNSISIFKRITSQEGLPNIQIYSLIKEVEGDVAISVGLENALGDFIAILDPLLDGIAFLPEMLSRSVSGFDVVFAKNDNKIHQTFAYRVSSSLFNVCYKYLSGVHLSDEAPYYRVISRRVVNFILQYPQPAITYRHLPATGGFSRINLTYSSLINPIYSKRLGDGIDRGMRLLVSTTRLPMRLVTLLSLYGAMANVLYSFYIIGIWLLKPDVAPGWASLSLQQSGMFFLLSLVLLVLGEYILHMVGVSNGGPSYYVGQEFTSSKLTRCQKLNVEEKIVFSDKNY